MSETSWLVEHPEARPHAWLAVAEQQGFGLYWETDASKGLRFARKTDAEQFIRFSHTSVAFVTAGVATEHMWSAAHGAAVALADIREAADAIERLQAELADKTQDWKTVCGNLDRCKEALAAMTAERDALRKMLQKIMGRLADVLDSDQFNNIEAMALEAGVPYPDAAKDTEEDERDDSPYCECGNFPCEEEEAANHCSCCGKRLEP
jgi:hypothetical protein